MTSYYLELQPIIGEKFVELNETIVLRQTQGFAGAQAAVSTNVGEDYVNQIPGAGRPDDQPQRR